MVATIAVVWPIIVAIFVGFIGLRLFGVLSPCIVLDTKVSSLSSDIVVVRIEVRNTSRVTVKRTRVLFAIQWLQKIDVMTPGVSGDCVIRDWVDFAKAEEILVSTESLNANETIVVERAYATAGASYVQTGLQFFSDQSRFQRALRPLWPRSLRWTTTRIHSLSLPTELVIPLHRTEGPGSQPAGIPVRP